MTTGDTARYTTIIMGRDAWLTLPYTSCSLFKGQWADCERGLLEALLYARRHASYEAFDGFPCYRRWTVVIIRKSDNEVVVVSKNCWTFKAARRLSRNLKRLDKKFKVSNTKPDVSKILISEI